MIKFINRVTGTTMWVADNRAEEYLAAGHTPVAEKPAEKHVVEKPVKKKK